MRIGQRGDVTDEFSAAKSSKLVLMLNDLEFAYSPVREKVRDLREYL